MTTTNIMRVHTRHEMIKNNDILSSESGWLSNDRDSDLMVELKKLSNVIKIKPLQKCTHQHKMRTYYMHYLFRSEKDQSESIELQCYVRK